MLIKFKKFGGKRKIFNLNKIKKNNVIKKIYKKINKKIK
jgi:hypothetical protein